MDELNAGAGLEEGTKEFLLLDGSKPWDPMDGLLITEVFLLGDGRIEVNWVPVDRAIPEEIEYLSERAELPVMRTQMQARLKDAEIHYLFSPDNNWRGIRCPKKVWALYMKSRGWTDEQVADFEARADKAPKKKFSLAPDTSEPTVSFGG